MGFGEWFGIVGGIISIIAFLFSVWIWMRSDIKVRELLGAIQAAHDISGSIMWELSKVPGEDAAVRLRQAEKALGLVSAIHTLSSKYADPKASRRQTDLDELLERGIIWSNAMIWDLERSALTKEVWLVSSDLEPDLSEPEAGSLVNKNVRAGTRYTYFYPEGLGDIAELRARMLVNLDVTKSPRLQNMISFVAVDSEVHRGLFRPGNVIFYFEGDPLTAAMHALEEVVLTKIPRRGLLWQELTRPAAEELVRKLRLERAKLAIDVK
jgi:hypothetical protein